MAERPPHLAAHPDRSGPAHGGRAVNLVWALGRAALRAAIQLAASRRRPGEESARSSGAAHLLLAAGIAALIAALPGLLVLLLIAASAPGAT